MSRGGSRNRSGPQADPNSARSEQRALTFKLLPRNGFKGRVPTFPLPDPTDREKKVWRELWRTPQAAMWDIERWRMHTIGHYCRWLVRSEAMDAPAATLGQVHRLADQLGITPAGMKENGWRIATDELAGKRGEDEDGADAAPEPQLPREQPGERRLRAVTA
ncbi:hypothetical protein GRS96_12420 [Rathayibacter sp. VKM Ac-2803]|uniref:hypothetical protein n=1 Tax=Rathayibacter sp. VKM Ac-2803 TaxID=2609256 RepID=UPI00135CD99A|nr:hypothetical protein [Rathayibacter sp. VKM Ac-2803]MWV50074.1 hypothetical protein [Rathayibacter sp. VKM Ac-2803]